LAATYVLVDQPLDGGDERHNPGDDRFGSAFAERWILTVREECLDHILIWNDAHLQRVLHEFVEDYYKVARQHLGIGQGIPLPRGQPIQSGALQK
jgi:hypothetical protein